MNHVKEDRVIVSRFEKVMMNQLNDCDDLSEWEAEFLNNIFEATHLSERQESQLNKMYDERFLPC